MKKKPESKYIVINLSIYRCVVVVTWEQDIDKIMKYVKKHGVKIKDDWKGVFETHQEKSAGVCITLGEDNTDCLVWIKERPKRASQYGTLYHELYHAVDHISEAHALTIDEKEARAYMFEYLVNNCNKILWR